MQILNLSIAFIFTISILLASCDKAENQPESQINYWDCHHKMIWDEITTKETLIGEWEWEYIACYWNPEDANDHDFKGMTIEFKSDNTLSLKENGQITETSNWKVVDGDAELFELEVDPFIGQIRGRILFCEKSVEFNDSYIDGCDNYFRKIE